MGNPSFPLLQYVDPYGNVIFNKLQMPDLLAEIGDWSKRFQRKRIAGSSSKSALLEDHAAPQCTSI